MQGVSDREVNLKDECMYCALPLTFDSYTKCPHACQYCYADLARGRHKITDKTHITLAKQINLARDKKDCLSRLLNSRFPIQFGTMADPFPAQERELRRTYKALAEFMFYGFPVYLTTKSDMIAEEPYLSLLKSNADKIVARVSFSTFDAELSKRLEPNAPTPEQRLRAIKILSENGIKIILRVQPYIFKFTRINDVVSAARSGGVQRVTVEPMRFTKIDPRHTARIFNAMGVTVEDYMSGIRKRVDDSYGGFSWYAYDPEYVRREFTELKLKLNEIGVQFGISGMGSGWANVDLNDGDYCCQVNDWAYDPDALVPRFKHGRLEELLAVENMTIKEYFELEQQNDLVNYHRWEVYNDRENWPIIMKPKGVCHAESKEESQSPEESQKG